MHVPGPRHRTDALGRRGHRYFALLGLVAACAAGCRPAPEAPAPSAATDIVLPADVTVIEDTVPARATLDAVLRAHNVGSEMVPQVVAAVRTAFNPRAFRAGQPYRLVLTTAGAFRSFEYTIDRDHYLEVADDGSSAFRSSILEFPTETATEAVSGAIDANHTSLIAAMNGSGEQIELALQLAQVFGGQVDFNSDLQPGDRFELLFEKVFHDGRFAGYGPIVTAALVNGGRRLQAFRFSAPDGETAYFDEQGRSVRRFFLPSPLPFDPRVTSGFSLRRMHPVLGFARAHLGVDYAAAAGTPVLAVADGTVVSAGYSGGSGRMVRLRHGNGYQTYYLHLSVIASGVRPGARVAQGQMIGKVGSTGLATGPHLDYRISKQGTFVNPLVERRNMPPGDPIPASAMADFEAARDDALAILTRQLQAPGVLLAGTAAGGAPRDRPQVVHSR